MADYSSNNIWLFLRVHETIHIAKKSEDLNW